MSGHSFVHLLLAAGALILNVSLALLLIPRLGGRGAAVASAITFAAWALARLATAWWLTRCLPFAPRTLLMLLGTALIVAGGLWAGRLDLPGGQVYPLVVCLLAYTGLAWSVGRTEDDHAVMAQVRSRLQRMFGRTG